MKPLLKQHFSRVSRIHFCNDGKCLLFYNPDALCYKKESTLSYACNITLQIVFYISNSN